MKRSLACLFILIISLLAFPELAETAPAAAQPEETQTAFEAEREQIRLKEIYDQALALENEGKYQQAIEQYMLCEGFEDSAERIKACRAALKEQVYQEALAMEAAGRYMDAAKTYKTLAGYKDASDRIETCREAQWGMVLSLLRTGRYDEADQAFEVLGNLSLDQEYRYQKARALYNAGDYEGAAKLYTALSGYKDVDEIVAKDARIAAAALLARYSVGGTVAFGAYEQDGNEKNGPEPIEWLVLDADGDNRLLLSKYALEKQPYHTRLTDVTWLTCALRKWLNGEFCKSAFSIGEQATILLTKNHTPGTEEYFEGEEPGAEAPTGGKDTQDRVFLLSTGEAQGYIDAGFDLRTALTDRAGGEPCGWWLRSPGSRQDRAAVVRPEMPSGEGDPVNWSGENVDEVFGVRPAIWLRLNVVIPSEEAQSDEAEGEPASVYPTLQKGSKGDAVVTLQKKLIELGYLSGKADGDFGKKTQAAVEAFQREAGLEATGVANSETQAALFAR